MTRHDHRCAAEICREQGWGVGTFLIGDAGYGPTVIRITALGDTVMLAKIVSHGRMAVAYHEAQAWSLLLRDWRAVG